MADRSPIFVVGRMRSGTTLLRQMLNAHPNIYLTFENDVFVYHWLYRNVTDPYEWLERYAREITFKLMEIDVSAVREMLPEDLTMDQIRLVFQAIMRAKAHSLGKTRYGDKTPSLWKNISFIFKHFEDPKIVHIVRDPRAVVHSLERVPWGMGSRLWSTLYCNVEMRDLERYRSRIYETRMEDLIANPRGILREVLDYVEEPWDESVLHYHELAPRDANHDWPGLSSATGALNKNKCNSAQEKTLGPVWSRLVEKLNAANMEMYGYRSFERERTPHVMECAAEVIKDVPTAIRYFYKLARLVYLIRYTDVPAQTKVETLFDLNPKGWSHHPGRSTPTLD